MAVYVGEKKPLGVQEAKKAEVKAEVKKAEVKKESGKKEK